MVLAEGQGLEHSITDLQMAHHWESNELCAEQAAITAHAAMEIIIYPQIKPPAY